ncbi:hypothetical protein OAS39_07645 [Pirellulales bacterium]|nr:hypothetical protein [Pirellulales bacterium]
MKHEPMCKPECWKSLAVVLLLAGLCQAAQLPVRPAVDAVPISEYNVWMWGHDLAQGNDTFLQATDYKSYSERGPILKKACRAYTTTPIDGGVHGVFLLGGQSYAAPHIFTDAYRLNRVNSLWDLQRLPDMLKKASLEESVGELRQICG